MARIRNLYAGRVATVVGLTLVATLGLVTGVIFAYSPDIAIIAELDDYSPGTITRIHARDDQLIGEYATERRMILTYDEIPEVLRHAIIAAEDGDFFSHAGFNIPRIVMTLLSNILEGDLTAAGASTITMQLARNVTLGGRSLGLEKTLQRKIVEAFYTLHIEKRYTKREILTLYANQIWLGTARHSAFGVEAASRLYFDKPAAELALGEAATIAGTIQRPAQHSPLVNMDMALNRRDYTLQRMVDEGHVGQAEADAVVARPIVLAERTERSNSIAPYFIEEVRKHLEQEYGAARLYEEGLTVHTTLDVRLQQAANRAVEAGLRAHDKRRGFRPSARNVLAEAAESGDAREPAEVLAAYEHYRWRLPMRAGDIVPAVVTGADREAMQVRFGSHTARVVPRGYHRDPDSGEFAGFRGLGGKRADELVTAGDLIEVEITALDATGGRPAAEAELEQEPLAEAALFAIENRTGRILAMVGGYDFDRSKFNRATQAYRQLGSLFKGMLYAAAIDQGYTTTSIVQDERISYDVGPGQPLYSPTNYDHTYQGPITLRRALEKSRNVPAVWIMNEIGPQVVLDFARRLGFTSEVPPYLSVALGSAEATLQEVTSAYSVFPNRGVRMVPYQIDRIVDREGEALEENRPVSQDAVPADTAYIMTSLMEGVVRRGTGVRASRLGWPLGGKTGTMDDYTDAWFVGFDPDITVGVWVGYDEKVTLGYDEQGARVALPVWIDFMRAHIDGREASPDGGFVPPANIVFAKVDPDTGEVAPWAGNAIQEAFIAGTAPGTELYP